MPGWAPSTPASHDPSVETTRPSSYSAVSSPRYQTFPSASCAYRSRVSSTVTPSAVTRSCTTRASMPMATVRISSRTVTSTRWTVPSASVSSYPQRSPTALGHHRLVMSTVKSSGSRSTGSAPSGRAAATSVTGGPGSSPHAVSTTATTSSPPMVRRRSAGALIGVLLVGLAADHGEVLVQLDVDLAPAGQSHLDLVVALLVADLGTRDPAAAGLGQSGLLGPFQVCTGDRGVGALAGVVGSGGCGDPGSAGGN